jgi:hypothetical protein
VSWLRRRHREDDLDREIRAHLDLEAEEGQENGKTSGEARHAAHRAFGNVTLVKEQTREAWGYTWLERLWQDLCFGARLLLKSPGFTAAAVLTLALGIGCTTAAFSAVYSILLPPLPFPGADRLVTVWNWNRQLDSPFYGTSGPDYLDWVERSDAFEALAAVGFRRLTLLRRDESQPVLAYTVTPNYFDVFQRPPVLGRAFTTAEAGSKGAHAVILSHTFWTSAFGANPDVVGKAVTMASGVYTIVGVVGKVKLARLSEQEFRPYIYSPLGPSCPAEIAFVVRTAGDQLGMANAIRHAIREIDPARAILRTETMQRQVEDSIAPERLLTLLLAGFTGFALLLSSLGVYGVMAFQVGQRTREMAIRMAFGARSRDVFHAVLRRGALLIILGLSIGLAGSLAVCRLLSSLLFEITPYDPATYVGALAFLASVALLSCWLPARHAANVDPMEALRGE